MPGRPYRTLSATVASNRNPSCGTITTRERSEAKATSSSGTQPAASDPSSTRPSTGSISRVTSLANVVLPEPVSPTIATRCRGAMVRSTPSSASRAPGA